MNSWTAQLTKVIYCYPPSLWSSPSSLLWPHCCNDRASVRMNYASAQRMRFLSSQWDSQTGPISRRLYQQRCLVWRLLPLFLFDSMTAFTLGGKPLQRDGFRAWLPYALLALNRVKLIAIFISSGREFCSQCRTASPVTAGFLRFPSSLIALCYMRLHFQREELSHAARALRTSQQSWNTLVVQCLWGKED